MVVKMAVMMAGAMVVLTAESKVVLKAVMMVVKMVGMMAGAMDC